MDFSSDDDFLCNRESSSKTVETTTKYSPKKREFFSSDNLWPKNHNSTSERKKQNRNIFSSGDILRKLEIKFGNSSLEASRKTLSLKDIQRKAPNVFNTRSLKDIQRDRSSRIERLNHIKPWSKSEFGNVYPNTTNITTIEKISGRINGKIKPFPSKTTELHKHTFSSTPNVATSLYRNSQTSSNSCDHLQSSATTTVALTNIDSGISQHFAAPRKRKKDDINTVETLYSTKLSIVPDITDREEKNEPPEVEKTARYFRSMLSSKVSSKSTRQDTATWPKPEIKITVQSDSDTENRETEAGRSSVILGIWNKKNNKRDVKSSPVVTSSCVGPSNMTSSNVTSSNVVTSSAMTSAFTNLGVKR